MKRMLVHISWNVGVGRRSKNSVLYEWQIRWCRGEEQGRRSRLSQSVGRRRRDGRQVVALFVYLILAGFHGVMVRAVFVSRHSLPHATEYLRDHLMFAHRRLASRINRQRLRANEYRAG